MKLVYTFCILMTCYFPSISQDGSEKKHRWSVGINTNVVIGGLFKINDNSIYNPFLADGRYFYNDYFFFSAGAGGHNQNNTEQVDGFADKITRDDWSLDLRLGVGWREILTTRWQLDYGIHLTSHMFGNNTIMDSGFDKISDLQQGFNAGLGPFISISYKILERFSIRSESSLYFMRGKTTTAKIFQSVPGSEDINIETVTNDVKTFLPINLYITFHF